MKIVVSIMLMLLSQLALPTELSESTPYMKLTSNENGSLNVYIGAFGSKAPRLNSQGNVEFYGFFSQERASNGSPKGKMYEKFNIANCDKQVYKTVLLGYRDSEFDKVVIIVPDGNSKERDNDINYLLKKAEIQQVKPDTIAAALVDAACNFVSKKENKVVPKEKDLEL